MATGYDNTITLLRRQIEALEQQNVFLLGINTKLVDVSSNSEQLNQVDSLLVQQSFQEELLEVSKEILEQIKALRGGEF